MTEPSSGDLARADLAETIRSLRAASGLSGKQLASKLHISPSKLSKIERGHRLPSEQDVLRLANVLELSDDKRESLVLSVRAALMQQVRQGGAYAPARDGQEIAADHEKQSTVVFEYAPTLVPGLLQSPAYARAILSDIPWANDERVVERSLVLRMQRQARLYSRDKVFEFLIADDVLDMPWAPELQAEQLKTLLDRLALPNVDLRIFPIAEVSPFARLSTFQLFDGRVAVIDTACGGVVVNDHSSLLAMKEMTSVVGSRAVSGESVRELIMDRLAAESESASCNAKW